MSRTLMAWFIDSEIMPHTDRERNVYESNCRRGLQCADLECYQFGEVILLSAR